MNLAFLASGNGSNMKVIYDACKNGELDASPKVMITDVRNCGALKIAEKIMICYCITSPREDYLISNILQEHEIDLVILAGYLRKVGPITLNNYKERILNIHPALLPKFGGKGMYGLKVHEAVIAAGEKVTGPTVHLVDEEYDNGRILSQCVTPVLQNDTPASLAERVLKEEHKIYAKTIQKFIHKEI